MAETLDSQGGRGRPECKGRICRTEKVKPVRAAEDGITATVGDRHMAPATTGKATTLARNCCSGGAMTREKSRDLAHCRKSPRLPILTFIIVSLDLGAWLCPEHTWYSPSTTKSM